jgi:hypothetical protein
MCADTVSYQYDFRLAEGTHKSFDVVLDAQTMDAARRSVDFRHIYGH